MKQPAIILIVDDIAANRLTLCELLDSPEYQLIEAADGPTALRLATETLPDLVLLDVMMPGMGGYEVCRRFRANPRLAEVQIIMVTALDDPASLIEGLEAGADDFLSKPVNATTLRARVRTIIRLNRYGRLVEARSALVTEKAELQKAEGEIQSINTQLEGRILERTARLEATNKESKLEIIDRKQIEALLRDSFKEIGDLKAALDEHAIVAITDPQGKITYVNDKFCAISKYSRAELVGRDHRIINSGHHPREFIGNLWSTITKGKVWKGEIKNKARDGSFYWVDTTIVPFLDETGKPRHYVAIRADITERKRFESTLQETNVELESARSAAEKANLAKSDFLSSMSHELRSPLNAILGFAQLMDGPSQSPTASQKARIAQILQAGWYLLKMIDEILDLATVESGKVSLSMEPVSLPDLMSICEAMMESQAQQRGIRMKFPRFDRPLFVSADRTRLQQIVINLLSNAIKYNREEGTVVVDCAAREPDRIRVSIKDTGAGLPPEKLAQLFQPFNRLGKEAGNVAGTGIGLVVTKRLAELMQGTIGVESIVGVGSVFWCELNSAEAPRLEKQNGKSAAGFQAPTSDDARKRSLLYVEDNPANTELVAQIIAEHSDLLLVTAMTGTLGIQIARATHPALILMDLNLPGMSGVQALKILRDDPVTAHIPIVALSANAMPRDIEKGLEAGFFRYLTKPIKVKEFTDTINTALEFAARTDAEAREEVHTP